MFALFNEYPTLLPEAAPGATTSDCRARAALKKPCIHCGATSEKALLAITRKAGRRWIDLCMECHEWVKEALDRIRKRTDEGSQTPWEEA